MTQRSVIFTESSPNLGGQELQLLQQMHALRDAGWQVHLVAKTSSRVGDLAQEQGLGFTAAPFRNALDFVTGSRLQSLLSKLKPAAVICHSNHDANITALTLKVLRNRARLIRMRTYLPKPGNPYAYNTLYHMAFTPSEYLRGEVLKNPAIRADKVAVMYPGIDFSKLDAPVEIPTALQQWLDAHPGPVIGHGSMLRGEKGQRTILAALPEVIKRHPTVRYVMGGEGYDKPELEKMIADMGLGEHVYFTGLLNPISPLLRVSTIAVMPSLFEPLGMFQIEATAMGIPTIASNTGGIPETIEHEVTGLLAAPDDVPAWTAAILRMLDNPQQAQQWAQEGSRRLRQQFAIERNTQQLMDAILS